MVESWEDLDGLQFTLPSSVHTVVVDIGFYKTGAYDTFLVQTVNTLLEDPLIVTRSIHSMCNLRTELAMRVCGSSLLGSQTSCSAVQIADARQIVIQLHEADLPG